MLPENPVAFPSERAVDRRRFLQWLGAGAAAVTLPGYARGGWGRADLLRTTEAAGDGSLYFSRFGITDGVLRRVLDRGLSLGGDFSEIYLEHGVAHSLGMMDGKVDRATTVVDLGAGIRVLKGDATGFAFTEDLSEKALLAAAAAAAAVAEANAVRRPQPLRASRYVSRYAVAVPWSEVGIDRKLPLLEIADATARAADARISKVVVSLGDTTTRVLIANSDGLLVEDDRPLALLYVDCVARAGDRTETTAEYISSRDDLSFMAEDKVRELAGRTARQAASLLEAIPAPVGSLPVVLAAGSSGILLHEAIGHGMEADFNRKKTSIYADRIGQRIASSEVTILDDGTPERLRGSLNIDDEGTPAQKTVLVENGVLRSYMHDRISAEHYRLASTGSGRRESFRFPPVPRMRNTYMLSGPHDPAEIIASIEHGLYAEEFSNGQVDIGGGDFSFYLKRGRLIEKGKLTSWVKDANLIGNGPQVLESIDLVGSDFAMYEAGGSCGKDGQTVPVGFGLPTVRIPSITVGGRRA